MSKKYVSLDRLTNYDALIKKEIADSVSGKADSGHSHDIAALGAASAEEVSQLSQKIDNLGDVASEDVVPMSKGGTEATDGAIGLKNLFAAGSTVLSSNQYASSLPSAGTKGRVFLVPDNTYIDHGSGSSTISANATVTLSSSIIGRTVFANLNYKRAVGYVVGSAGSRTITFSATSVGTTTTHDMAYFNVSDDGLTLTAVSVRRITISSSGAVTVSVPSIQFGAVYSLG